MPSANLAPRWTLRSMSFSKADIANMQALAFCGLRTCGFVSKPLEPKESCTLGSCFAATIKPSRLKRGEPRSSKYSLNRRAARSFCNCLWRFNSLTRTLLSLPHIASRAASSTSRMCSVAPLADKGPVLRIVGSRTLSASSAPPRCWSPREAAPLPVVKLGKVTVHSRAETAGFPPFNVPLSGIAARANLGARPPSPRRCPGRPG
mmetsp:Transcript_112276/g.290051  ORF Transcript_112276/g.290051 Transcript_112276/m.290051 type:complete len:205 (+) Transcript_112276:427-1041(+)